MTLGSSATRERRHEDAIWQGERAELEGRAEIGRHEKVFRLKTVRLLEKAGEKVVLWHTSRRNAKIAWKNPYLLHLFLSS
jgi:hypothetical protein